MKNPETRWSLIVFSVCFWAMYNLLSFQVLVDLKYASGFLFTEKLTIETLLIVCGVSFLAGRYCFSLTAEILLGISVGVVWYFCVDPHQEYSFGDSSFAAIMFNFYLKSGLMVNLVLYTVAPVLASAVLGHMLYQHVEYLGKQNRRE